MGMHFSYSQWCVLLMNLQLNFELCGSELHVVYLIKNVDIAHNNVKAL